MHKSLLWASENQTWNVSTCMKSLMKEGGEALTSTCSTHLTPPYTHLNAPRWPQKVAFNAPCAIQQKGHYGSLEKAQMLALISHAPSQPQHERLFLGVTLPEVLL